MAGWVKEGCSPGAPIRAERYGLEGCKEEVGREERDEKVVSVLREERDELGGIEREGGRLAEE